MFNHKIALILSFIARLGSWFLLSSQIMQQEVLEFEEMEEATL